MRRILSIDDGNQDKLTYAPQLPASWLKELQDKYSWTRFNEYDNRVYEFMYHVLEPALKKSRLRRLETLWDRLTRPQKAFYALVTFDGQVKNGGVYQFLFNYPELAIATLESFAEIGEKSLKSDYERTLSEFIGKASRIGELKRAFNDQSNEWNARWNSFVEGYTELKTAKKIESYFYTKKFNKAHFHLISEYIETNLHRMAKIAR